MSTASIIYINHIQWQAKAWSPLLKVSVTVNSYVSRILIDLQKAES